MMYDCRGKVHLRGLLRSGVRGLGRLGWLASLWTLLSVSAHAEPPAESAPPPSPQAVASPDLPRPKVVPAAFVKKDCLLCADPHLPERVKVRLAGTTVSGVYKVCVATSGQVQAVDILTAIPDADEAIKATIRAWQFRPRAVPVCFVQSFDFQIERPKPAPSAPEPETLSQPIGRYDLLEYGIPIYISKDAQGAVRPEQVLTGLTQALNDLGLARAREKDPRWAAQAEPNYKRELAAAEQALGPEHAELVPKLLRLARICVTLKKHGEAEGFFRRALAISEKALGPGHGQRLSALDQLANFYEHAERYGDAAQLRAKELVFIEKENGPESPEVVRALVLLSKLFLWQGLYEEAAAAAQRTLAIREKKLGPDSLQVAGSLTALAEIYTAQGKYEAAESLAKRALTLFESGQRGDSVEIVPTLTALGVLHRQQGEYSQAEPYYKRALAIVEKALEPLHPEIATRLNSLACFYLAGGQLAQAEPLLTRALAIREKIRGPIHSDVANILHNLSVLYLQRGQLAEAEQLIKRVIAIQERTLGTEHPELAQGYAGLAAISWNQGRHAQAEALLKRALMIQERQLGPGHPDVGESLSALAALVLRQGKKSEALPLFQRALQIDEAARSQAASESRVTSLLSLSQKDVDLVTNLLLEPEREPQLLPLALSLSLLRKGRAAEAGQQANQAIADSLTAPGQQAAFTQWKELRALREQLFFAGSGTLPLPEYQSRLAALQVRIEALEQALAAGSPRLRSLKTPRLEEVVSLVASKLPQGSALLEVVWTQRVLVDSAERKVLPSGGHYIAMLLFPDQRIEVADLGETAAVDHAVSELLAVLRDRTQNPLPAAQRLYQRILQPLARPLNGVAQLYLSLEGSLNLVPFAALHDGKQYLLDRYQLHYLTSGRDLLREPAVPSSRPALILADPDYGQAQAPTKTGDARAAAPGKIPDLYRLLQRLGRLPETRKEAQALARLLPQAEVRLDQAATEQTLRQGGAPRIIHIATHGVFLDTALPLPSVPAKGPEAEGFAHTFAPLDQALPSELAQLSGLRQKAGSLSRSFLALAGAAHADQSPGPDQDGILTAEEVRSLNLSGTELVVLSACDTGVGGIRIGEGVYGLRRAFLIAGAQTLVASLWAVADVETGELMKLYYERLVKRGRSRIAAMQEAMKETRKRKPHPYYWAPFIAIGQDGPLTLN